MHYLPKLLIIKILLTIFVWSLPLLLFPANFLTWLGFAVPNPIIFLKLLGMAYLALALGYITGLRDYLKGIYPVGTLWMGIISNGGAFLILATAALFDIWHTWGIFAQLFMWFSLISTGAIAVALTFELYINNQRN